jgi:hypothetical protein
MVDILTVLILIIDFGFSIWNAYASGLNVEMLRREGGSSWLRAVAYSGLGLAYCGATYVMVIVVGYVAYAFGYVSADVVDGVLGLDFLLFGLLIIGFGLMVTVQSIIVAARKRSLGNVAVAVWNAFAEVWDIASYAEGFRDAISMVRGGSRDQNDETSLILIVLVALLLAYFMVHAAYMQGKRKAQGSGSSSYGRYGRDAGF